MPENKDVLYPIQEGTKFSLIEMMIIVLLVGLIFVFVVPINHSRIVQTRVNKAMEVLKEIGDKAQAFKNDPANGYYPFDLSQLNLPIYPDTTFFSYSINDKDSTVVAKTTKKFGGKTAYLVYDMPTKQFRIGRNDSDMDSKRIIHESWLQ